MPANIKPVRSQSIASSSAVLEPAYIEQARVINVDIRGYTCDVVTEFSMKNRFDIPFMVPYCDQTQGEGIAFMPEVGSTCWICSPSEGGRDSFILGWTMIDEGGDYRGGRENLNPGDLHFSTRDGNFIHLRRGGIIQVGSTPICQRIYLPIRNVIQDLAENYEMHTPGGDLTWKVARTEEDSGGHQMCTWTLGVKEFADDPNEDLVGVLKFGSHGDGNTTILSLVTRDAGGGAIQSHLQIDKSGQVTWNMQKLVLSVEGDAEATIDGVLVLSATGSIDISTNDAMYVAARVIQMSAGASVLEMSNSGVILDGIKVDIGEALYPVVRASPDLVTWIGTVTALLLGPPPPAPPVPANKGPIINPVLHVSPKVKV